jgi:hypothetical protein
MNRTTVAMLLATIFVFAHHEASATLRDAADNHDLARVKSNFKKSVRSHDGLAVDRKTATAVVREVEHPR